MKRPAVDLLAFVFVVAMQLAYAQDPSPSKPKREGAISGRVFSEDGQPLLGAQVIAVPAGKLSFNFSPTTATTDDEGNFKLSGLGYGSYLFISKSPGYVKMRNRANVVHHRVGESVVINMVKGGIITGRVTDESGEPMVGIRVFAQRVRDPEGHAEFGVNVMADREAGRVTDDRGVYRIYGLEPGVYVVKVAGLPFPFSGGSTMVLGAPIYHPSASRGSATEITLHSGEEVANVDIRFRESRGRSISGEILGDVGGEGFLNGVLVALLSLADKQIVGTSTVMGGRRFSIHGIEDGEYQVMAVKFNERFDFESSLPRRVTVRGADLTGIDLRLAKLASVSGRVMVETSKSGEACKGTEGFTVEEILVKSKRDDNLQSLFTSAFMQNEFPFGAGSTQPDEKGEFTIKNLEAGRVRLSADLPGESWYIRAITQHTTLTSPPADISRTGASIKPGEKFSGVEIKIAEGAATLSGKVVPDIEGGKLPKHLRIYLIPAETTTIDEVLRYRELMAAASDSFEFKNIAPGKYWLHARGANETGRDRPEAWDPVERAKLRREAEAAKNEIDLQPCQKVKNHVLRIDLTNNARNR